MQYPPHRFLSISADRLVSHSTSPSSTPRPPERIIPGPDAHSPPPHFRSYTSYIPTLGRILDYRILGLTIHQLVVLAAYITVTAIGLLYRSNPTTNVTRAGYLVVSQMPIVFALGMKNSVVTLLTGISYEKSNFLHRWVGRVMFIAALFHFVGWLVLWTKLGITRKAGKSSMSFMSLVYHTRHSPT
ncbi:hypothetical protein FRC08_017781 [Ceratobasidium sp. 394]|nr:hypothetical protein FRC08_017781 [Ceratobasidium sp. 394]